MLNPFNPKETRDDKLSILDIKARDQSGRQFNVEMQMLACPNYEKRILYYWAKLHQQQMHEGEDYLTLQPTISISFLNHVLFPTISDYHLRFHLLEQSHRLLLSEDVEFHLFELPKFNKSLKDSIGGSDLWLYFLRHAEKMDTDAPPAALLDQPLVLRALEELKMLSHSDVERERYESRRKAQLDYNTGMKVARLEGLAEGRAEGRAEGIIRGEKVGVIHLCEQLLNQPQTATEQLAGLSLEELNRLANDLKARVEKR